MSIVQSTIERLRKSHPNGDDHARGPAQEERKAAARAEKRGAPGAVPWRPELSAQGCDIESLRAGGLYPPKEFVPRVREEYRSIRRQVLAASLEKIGPTQQPVGPVVVVTSAMPGDGKSYTALNLAVSIAREGVRDVLLVDADTIKRSTSIACGLRDRPGLCELLGGQASDFLDVSFSTGVPKLHVLPAGDRSRTSTDLFCAARVGPFFESLRTVMSDHFVVIDTPPILLSNDTAVLADLAGQVLLVVRAGITLQDAAREAVARVNQQVPVGVVLNGWSPVLASDKRTYQAYDEYVV